LLIHAGDFSFAYSGKQSSQLRDFDDWLGELRHQHKIVVPGNHDSVLEDPKMRDELTNATVLVNSGVEVEGLKIWGSPVNLEGVAFRMSKPEDRKRHWARIPKGIDILISHGPPFGILDVETGKHEHAGDPELLEAVNRVKPRLHVFGHVHGAYGTMASKHTKFINAALYGEFGELDKPPVVLELNPSPRERR
jgi:Icc-related predicted phosphoesterase